MIDLAPASTSLSTDEDEVVARLAVIREAGLFVDDPEMIADRHHPIPADMEPVRLLSDYDTSRTTGRKVRCAACAHQQYHHRGFVAQMPDGRPALIGINCGEKHFGDGKWGQMNAELRREQEEVYFEARVAPALAQIQASYERAIALKGPLRKHEDERRYLKVQMPELVQLLNAACARNEGNLDRYVRRTVQVVSRSGRPEQREQVDTVRFGKVPEPWAFIARSAVHDLDAAIATLRTAKLKLERGADTRSRREAFNDLARGRRLAEDVARKVRGDASNSAPDWWAHAVRFCLAEGAAEKLTLLHRTLQLGDGWSNRIATIPRCTAADAAHADELAATWPTGA